VILRFANEDTYKHRLYSSREKVVNVNEVIQLSITVSLGQANENHAPRKISPQPTPDASVNSSSAEAVAGAS